MWLRKQFFSVFLTIAAGRLAGVANDSRAQTPDAAATPAPEPRGAPALTWARRFAEAVRNDENDRGRSLAKVAEAWLARGEPDRAAEVLAERERGHWAVLAAMADVAAEWAVRGDTERARAWVSEARKRADELRGAARDRVLLRIARALSALGDHDVVAATFSRFAEVRDYAPEVRALQATAWARAGRVEEALALLDGAEGDLFYESRVWRSRAYAHVARVLARDGERWGAALQRAWDAAAQVPDYQRFPLRLDVIAAETAFGRGDSALRRLNELTDALPAEDAAPHIFLPIMADCAAAYGRLNEKERARALLESVERQIPKLLIIEQPELWARAGEAFMAAGDRAAALERYTRALESARPLVNPRPRALAGVAIALSLDRAGLEDATLEGGLDQLARTFDL